MRPALLRIFLLLLATGPLPAEPPRTFGKVLPLTAKAEIAVYPPCESYEEARKRLTTRGLPVPRASVSPDKAGAFSLEMPAALRLNVVVRAPGFVPHTYEWWRQEEPAKLHAIELEPARPRGVTLVDASGRALPGVRVGTLPQEISDAEGRVTLPEGKDRTEAILILDPRFLGAVELPADGRVVLQPAKGVVFQVRDPRNQPVPGALVRLLGEHAIGFTDGQGRLAVESLNPSGQLPVAVEGPSGEWTNVIARVGPERETLTVTLLPAETVAGRVVDAVTLGPVAGAEVGGDSGCSSVQTAADGTFRLSLPRENRNLSVIATGYNMSTKRVDAGQDDLTLPLLREGELAGVVVDESGKPVAGAQLTCKTASPWYSDLCRPEVVSGKDGSFRLPALLGGFDYTVSASLAGYTPASTTAQVPGLGETAAPLRLTLLRGSELIGRVVDERGRPVPGAELKLGFLDLPNSWLEPLRAKTTKEGRFSFQPLTADDYVLSLRSSGFSSAEFRLDIVAGVSPLDLGEVVLSPAVALEGRVVDPQGRPVAGAEVAAEWQKGKGPKVFPSSSTVARADGRFRLQDLQEGESYHLTAGASGFADSLPLRVAAPGEEPVRLELRVLRTLAGRVTDDRGRPVHRASLWNPELRNGRSKAETDFQGRFSARVAAGELKLQIDAEGYAKRKLPPMQIPADRDPAELNVVLESGTVLSGRVTDRQGRSLSSVWVSASPLSAPGSNVADDSSDAAGSYRLEGLPPGSYEISAGSFARTVKKQILIGAEEQRLDLVLPDVQAVRGRLVTESGAPVGRVTMQWTGDGVEYKSVSAGDGTFVIPELPPGRYRIELRRGDFHGEPLSDVVVEKGTEKEQTLVFVPAEPAP